LGIGGYVPPVPQTRTDLRLTISGLFL
jgi:hypothetical protein